MPEKLIAVFSSRRATISDVTLRLAREHQARHGPAGSARCRRCASALTGSRAVAQAGRRAGLPGRTCANGRRSPGAGGSAAAGAAIARDREVGEIVAALAGAGTLERRRLARLVRADLWGPGRFSSALRAAVVQGRCAARAGACRRLCPVRRVPVTTHRPLITPSTATEPGSGPEQGVIPVHLAGSQHLDRPTAAPRPPRECGWQLPRPPWPRNHLLNVTPMNMRRHAF